jgi:metallophosphoesterase (TIGR00282 family)
MNILYLGDLVGRAGREAVIAHLPTLRERLAVDFTVVNAENAAAGFGCTRRIADDLLAAGVDVITLGDHAFDQKEMLAHLGQEPRIVRPLNIAKSAPGVGFRVFEASRGRRVAVGVVLGRIFMKQPFDDPFSAVDAAIKPHALGATVNATLIELHAEATSEKMALGHYLDGRVSLAVGAHTHVPTADAQVLRRGTAYQTDAGMCGDYDSVIGMDKAEPLRRFVTGMNGERFSPAEGEATIAGVLVETDDATGLARRVAPVRFGGRLAESLPGAAG